MGSSPLPHLSLPSHLHPQTAGFSACRYILRKTLSLTFALLVAFLLLPGIYNFGWGQTTIYSQDFEGTHGWTLNGNFGVNTQTIAEHSGTKCLYTVQDGNYASNLTESANYTISPTINCTGYSSTQLQYWSYSDFENPNDHGYVYISGDNGASWSQVEDFSATEGSWTLHTIDISAIADNSSHVQIGFTMSSNNNKQRTGWNVDDVAVKGYLPPAGDPAIFGNGVWNVYGYKGGNIDLSGIYCGYYTENNLSYVTTTQWNANGSPSDAAGWQGSPIPNDNHIVVSKRTNFTCGYYQLDMPSHDDDVRVYINGILVFSHEPGCCDSHTNIWTGYLTPT